MFSGVFLHEMCIKLFFEKLEAALKNTRILKHAESCIQSNLSSQPKPAGLLYKMWVGLNMSSLRKKRPS